MTTAIEIVPDHPYAPGGVPTKELRVSGIGFAAYARAMKAAGNAKTDAEARRRTTRERMKLQVVAVGIDGKEHRLTDADISAMPIPYAVRLRDEMTMAMFAGDAGEPKMVHEGNGYTTPIHIALGTPIKAAGGIEIAELEFVAKTVSELEDVLSLDRNFDQTEALLALASPVSGSLSTLPSWAIEQISLTDGLFILNKVRPAFFEPTSS